MTNTLEAVEVIDHETLGAALVAFQAEVAAVPKDATNPFFSSKYADLPAVKAAAQPLLAKHGLAVIQEPGYVVAEGKVYDTLATTLVHKKMSYESAIRSTMILKLAKNDAQSHGSAITYARRYAFMSVLGLVADEDDDGNAATGNTRQAKPRQSRAKAKQEPDENNELRDAQARVKAAAKAAGVAPTDATDYFKKEYQEDSLIGCSDVAKLTAAAEHWEAIAAAKNELGATEA